MENELMVAQATLHDIQALLSAMKTALWLIYAAVNLLFLVTGICMGMRGVPKKINLIFAAAYGVSSLPALFKDPGALPLFLTPVLCYLTGVWSGDKLKRKLKTQP